MTQTMTIGPPKESDYDPYYHSYMQLVEETDILSTLLAQIQEFRQVLDRIPADQSDRIHAPYTWTIKQVVGHIIDNERVFGYRALRFATGDLEPLPGYDQNAYADNMDYTLTTLPQLVDELNYCRQANIGFLNRVSESSWDNKGTADGNQISVRAIAYLLVGHLRHHLNIIDKRVAD